MSVVAETYGFTIYWRIENFDSDPADDLHIKSQVFKIYSMNANWQIEIEVDEEEEYLSAYLCKISNNAYFPVNYSLSLLTGSGWITILENERKKFKAGGEGFGDDLVSLEKLKREEWFYLPNGSLTISFHIWNGRIRTESTQRLMISRLIDGEYLRHRPIQTFSTLKPSDLFSFPLSYEFQFNPMPTLNSQNAKQIKTQQTQTEANFNVEGRQNAIEVKIQQTQTDAKFSVKDCQDVKEIKTRHTQTEANFDADDLNDLRKLFQEKEFSFVTFRTLTKEFSVHKAVLCAKSPVFNAMFERKMKENDCNIVDIDDIDNQTMALFVKFLHYDPLDDLKFGSALSLYYVADKYQINSLKHQCVSILKRELSVENICEVLLLADLHQDSDLMNRAVEYFCKNSKTIMPSKQWKDFLCNTELVAKLLCKLAEVMP